MCLLSQMEKKKFFELCIPNRSVWGVASGASEIDED